MLRIVAWWLASTLLVATSLSAVAQAAGGEAPAAWETLEEQFQRRELLRQRIAEAERALAALSSQDRRPGANFASDRRVAAAPPHEPGLPDWMFVEAGISRDAAAGGQAGANGVRKRTFDADGDGRADLVEFVDPDSGELLRVETDEDCDGVTDAWSRYQRGALVERVLDQSGDGKADVFEQYADGRMTSLEIDRDDDGTRDAFYRYRGDYLTEEAHDSDADGAVDLRVHYAERSRLYSEQDADRDGKMDTRTTYHRIQGKELIERIERTPGDLDAPVTIEFYEPRDGRAVLVRREEDIDRNGTPDVTSYFENGRLVRREISARE